MVKQAKITSKGQITVPVAIRRALGVGPGDTLSFESGGDGVKVLPVRRGSRFAKYRGIGSKGIGSGRTAVTRWLRGLRGE